VSIVTEIKRNLSKLESLLDSYLIEKIPGLPSAWKELIVKVLPWLIIVVTVLSLPQLLVVFGLGAIVMPFSYLGSPLTQNSLTINWLFAVISMVLAVFSVPKLFKKEREGWNLLFYSSLVSALSSLLFLNLGNLIIGTGLSLYILFQIKEFYK
jgi:uncharacterized membrane protein (DUF485 family)